MSNTKFSRGEGSTFDLRLWIWDHKLSAKEKLLLLALAEHVENASNVVNISEGILGQLVNWTGLPSQKIWNTCTTLRDHGFMHVSNRSATGTFSIFLMTETVPYAENVESRHTAPGYVYLLRSGMDYKIGRTANLSQRISNLSTAAPCGLELVAFRGVTDSRSYESYLHQRYAHRRSNGEWFRLSKTEAAAIAEALRSKKVSA